MQMKEYAQAKAEELNGVAGEASRVRMAAGYHTAQTAIEDTFQFYGQVLKERRDELLQSLDNMYDEKQSTMNVSQVWIMLRMYGTTSPYKLMMKFVVDRVRKISEKCKVTVTIGDFSSASRGIYVTIT